jgi:hypothetical protein
MNQIVSRVDPVQQGPVYKRAVKKGNASKILEV